jgi:23S rRNA pseudouridine2604 synthase
MAVRNILHYLLINRLKMSKKEALQAIESGGVRINEIVVTTNCYFKKTDDIYYKTTKLQDAQKTLTIAFYKPRGIETTLNENIMNNLKMILPFEEHLYPIGRLDKESEGLLLLTNDGQLYRELNHYGTSVEKEYIVKVDNIITESFLLNMANGVEIMGQKTLPCKIQQIDNQTFNIILIQGLNRQIRRMCYKLGYEVTELKRIRIGGFLLGDLAVGAYKVVNSVDE